MTDKYARVWSGTEWVNVSSPVASPNAVAVYQATAPSSPVTGQIWIDSDDNASYVWNGSSWGPSPNLSLYAPIASPTFTGTTTIPTLSLTTADTATAATHYMVEIATDGVVRPKTLANTRTEIVTTAAVNSAAATTVGTISSGTWQGSVISGTYIDSAIARLASPTFTGTPAAPTAAANTNTTQIATTAFVTTADNLKANLASPTFTGTVTAADAVVNGLLTVAETTEVLNSGTIASNIFTADFATGGVFYITTAPTANFTINVTNLPTTDNRVTVVSFFVIQGATGYIPNALQIGGAAQTIKWSGGAAPTATSGAGKVDNFTFTFIRRGAAWEALGTSNRNF